MGSRLPIAVTGAILAAILVPAAAAAENQSYPATYTGSAATGGRVEFDVSASGNSVTRFATAAVPTSCGMATGTGAGVFAINNDTFYSGSSNSPGLRFSGTFDAQQHAKGVLSLRLVGLGGCTSEEVSWTATTTVPAPDKAPPQTKIKSGPKGHTHSIKATFKFSSTEGGSTFFCKLDGKAWGSCKSPRTYKHLKPGEHTFRVRARDKAGNVDQSPAKRSWHVEKQG